MTLKRILEELYESGAEKQNKEIAIAFAELSIAMHLDNEKELNKRLGKDKDTNTS